jgi:hypothetical protein
MAFRDRNGKQMVWWNGSGKAKSFYICEIWAWTGTVFTKLRPGFPGPGNRTVQFVVINATKYKMRVGAQAGHTIKSRESVNPPGFTPIIWSGGPCAPHTIKSRGVRKTRIFRPKFQSGLSMRNFDENLWQRRNQTSSTIESIRAPPSATRWFRKRGVFPPGFTINKSHQETLTSFAVHPLLLFKCLPKYFLNAS